MRRQNTDGEGLLWRLGAQRDRLSLYSKWKLCLNQVGPYNCPGGLLAWREVPVGPVRHQRGPGHAAALVVDSRVLACAYVRTAY